MKRHSLLAACVFCSALGLAQAEAKIVAIDLDLPLDQIGVGRPFKPGDHHRARVFYDDAKIDPKTHRVTPLHMQHLVGGKWLPAHIDAKEMPMGDSWLDLGATPWRYHYHSATVQMGEATITDFDEKNRRMTIRLEKDNSVVVSAPYVFQKADISDADIAALTAAN